MRQGKLKVIFNSRPSEITPDAVVLDVNGSSQRIPSEYGWIFAGGEPPAAFLKKIGIGFGPQDLTSEGQAGARVGHHSCVIAKSLALPPNWAIGRQETREVLYNYRALHVGA